MPMVTIQLQLSTGETKTLSVDSGVTLTALTLRLVFEDSQGLDVAVVEAADITISTTTFTFAVPAALTSQARFCNWSLRVVSTGEVKAYGTLVVSYLPTKD